MRQYPTVILHAATMHSLHYHPNHDHRHRSFYSHYRHQQTLKLVVPLLPSIGPYTATCMSMLLQCISLMEGTGILQSFADLSFQTWIMHPVPYDVGRPSKLPPQFLGSSIA